MLYFNKYVNFRYSTDKEYDAGLVLNGKQVKEIRSGKFNLKESTIRLDKGELWIFNTGLSTDKVKLLLNGFEINRIFTYLQEKKHHVYAIGIFEDKRRLKLRIGAGIIKKEYQKTEQQRRKDAKIEIAQEFKKKNYDY